MKEDGVLKILFWFSPALSAILIVLQIGENFVRFSDRPVLFYYSYCAKTPFPAEVVGDLAVFKLMMLCTVPVLIGEMCCHIAIFAKQWQIEARATVYVIKNNRLVSRQRHHRNVVSATGHVVSFVVSIAETTLLIKAFYFLSDSEETFVMIRNINMFLIPSIYFVVYPFIQTIFSDTLRDSLGVIPCTACPCIFHHQ